MNSALASISTLFFRGACALATAAALPIRLSEKLRSTAWRIGASLRGGVPMLGRLAARRWAQTSETGHELTATGGEEAAHLVARDPASPMLWVTLTGEEERPIPHRFRDLDHLVVPCARCRRSPYFLLWRP